MGDSFGDQCGIDFEDIPNQINRREMAIEHSFNLMLVGLSGVGKSTLVKSLFQGMIKPDNTQGQKLYSYEELLIENGVKLRLRCVETSNYDYHKKEDYSGYIDEQFKFYLKEHCRKASWNIKDNRIHCCLYMIPPYGHMKLRKEDIECMKALHKKVNLVPIIAKADAFNATQLAKFKANIIEDLEANKVECFKFQCDDKEDEERSKLVRVEAERFPFAIVAADEPTPVADGKKNRWIRSSIYGQMDISDSRICDFDALAKLLIRHCMLDLIDSTHVKHYAKFKDEILEAARFQGAKNLKAMGLESHEIKRLEYYNNPNVKLNGSGNSGLYGFDDKRLEMERELQLLRAKLQALQKPSISAYRSAKFTA